MDREQEHVDFENPTERVEVKVGGVRFGGSLYERKPGGFDVYLSLEYSDTDSLAQEKFNVLYDQADAGQEVFIATFPDREISRDLLRRVREVLQQWLEVQIGTR